MWYYEHDTMACSERLQFCQVQMDICEWNISEATFNSYCYIHDTFTLAEERHTGVYPGVGPGAGPGEPEVIHHSYYQWVPILLLIQAGRRFREGVFKNHVHFQAASFYTPYILYKFAHDNRIPNLIQDLQNTKPFNEIRDDKLGDIHIYLQVLNTD